MRLRTLLAVAAIIAAPSVATAVQSPVPTPESVLGFTVGADFELATYDESIAYFRSLDAASDRLQLQDVGRTSEGRPWYIPCSPSGSPKSTTRGRAAA